MPNSRLLWTRSAVGALGMAMPCPAVIQFTALQQSGLTFPMDGAKHPPMRDLDEVFAELARSAFRRRFRLSTREQEYLRAKGLPIVLSYTRDFVAQRLAPAQPVSDGKQTPFQGHPAFTAQHATVTCRRSCLAKWHGIQTGKELTAEERDHIVGAIARWIST